MTVEDELQPVRYAHDSWHLGQDYLRRLRVYKELEDGSFEQLDLSSFPNLRVRVKGARGTRGDISLGSAAYDAQRGGAAEGAILVFLGKDLLSLDRKGERDGVIFTVIANAGREDRLVANVRLTVLDTAAG